MGGPWEAIARLDGERAAAGVAARRLQTSHAFHTAMMDPMLEAFRAEVESVALAEPSIPWISSLTGALVDTATALDPGDRSPAQHQTTAVAEGCLRLPIAPQTAVLLF